MTVKLLTKKQYIFILFEFLCLINLTWRIYDIFDLAWICTGDDYIWTWISLFQTVGIFCLFINRCCKSLPIFLLLCTNWWVKNVNNKNRIYPHMNCTVFMHWFQTFPPHFGFFGYVSNSRSRKSQNKKNNFFLSCLNTFYTIFLRILTSCLDTCWHLA